MYKIKNSFGFSLLSSIFLLMLFFFNPNLHALSKPDMLSQRVKNALTYHLNNHLSVTSSNGGIITIEGTVKRLYDKYRIFDIAEKVKGVKGIRDLVAVNTRTLPDDMIKANLLEDIRVDNSILEPNRINVAVSNGLIQLRGTVSYPREKLLAATLASWQRGALGIVNRIKVLSPKAAESNKNMKILLGDVLKDKFPLQSNLQVTVHNGIVKIKGYADSSWAKYHLTKDFSRIKGVKKIINDITTNQNSTAATA